MTKTTTRTTKQLTGYGNYEAPIILSINMDIKSKARHEHEQTEFPYSHPVAVAVFESVPTV